MFPSWPQNTYIWLIVSFDMLNRSKKLMGVFSRDNVYTNPRIWNVHLLNQQKHCKQAKNNPIQWPDFLDKYANFIPGTAHDSFLHFRPQLCPLNSPGIVFCAAHFYVSRLSFRARIAFYPSHSLMCLSATSVFCPNPFLLLSYLFWLPSLSKFLSSTQLWSTFQKRFFTIFYSSFTVASLGFT